MGAVIAACALVAVLCAGVTTGIDVGIAMVLRGVLDRMDSEQADALAGRLLRGGQRLRVVWLTGVVATGGLVVATRVGTPASSLAIAGLAFLLLQLLLTIKVEGPRDPSTPVGGRGHLEEDRNLQAGDDRMARSRWESVMMLRAGAGVVALTCITLSVLVSGRLL